jgi:hypothetical protein
LDKIWSSFGDQFDRVRTGDLCLGKVPIQPGIPPTDYLVD